MRKTPVLLCGLFIFASVQAQLSFTQAPSIAYTGSAWTISFGVSQYTDVEVTVVKASDTSVVRRLAAGKLGANPPPPFTANSLTQAFTWDGRDDLGNTVSSSLALAVRVRAGMSFVMEKTAGANPYYFSSISSVAYDPDAGRLYVLGAHNAMNANVALRRYDSNGDYAKTLYPCPAGLDTGGVTPWVYYKRADKAYFPMYETYWIPELSLDGSVAIKAKNLLPYTVDHSILMTSGADSFFLMDSSGSTLRGRFSQGLPALYTFSTCPYKNSWYYIIGRDVYRLDPRTSQRSLWHNFPVGDSVQSLYGLAFDDSGHVFICDRTRQAVWVYDTLTWAVSGVVNTPSPGQIAVNSAASEIYVLNGLGTVYVRKYRNWRSPVLVDSISAGDATRFFLSTRGASPVLFLAGTNVRILRDQGNGYTVLRDFQASSAEIRNGSAPSTYEQISVDRRSETVYVTTAMCELYKIVDWNTCRVVQCSTSSRSPLWAVQSEVSPDGFLYVQQGTGGGTYSGPITKWTTDYYHAPSNYGSTASNVADQEVYGRAGSGFLGEKGIAISRDNKVADIPIVYNTWAAYNLRVIDPADPVGSRAAQLTDGVIYPLADHGAWMGTADVPTNVGNVKFDFDGNIYISTSLTAPGHVLPQRYPMNPPTNYRNITVGAVYKFPPTGGSFTKLAPVGALKSYPQGLSLFSGGSNEWGIGCACRTPRFDLDPWGRLWIPHGLLCEIAVVDNIGNELCKIAGYGNIDSKGPGMAFMSPTCVAASDNYLYVSDPNNCRVVRVRMDFALNNLGPALTDESGPVLPDEAALKSRPNPFNPESRITVAMEKAGPAVLEVFDISGRLVQKIYSGNLKSGRSYFTWKAVDARGHRVSAGVYVYRLRAAGKVHCLKTLLSVK